MTGESALLTQLEESANQQEETEEELSSEPGEGKAGAVKKLADNILGSLSVSSRGKFNFEFDFESQQSANQNLITREIELEALDVDQQVASVLSLDPLEVDVAERMRLEWQVENPGMASSFEELAETFENKRHEFANAPETIVGVSISLTSGVLLWFLRGGALMASWWSISPVWKQFDPLPIVDNFAGKASGGTEDGDEDEDVEKMFKKDA